VAGLGEQGAATRRPTVAALEARLGETVPVLDHGFVRLVDYMGDDAAVVQAARVSYGKGTRESREDRGLIRYLMRHRHTTPFEMCELKMHIKLPMFVARQWIRHRMASVNEISARYSVLDREFYLPAAQDLAAQSSQNKQGRGEELEEASAEQVRSLMVEEAHRAHALYGRLLEDEGLARELARMTLPVSWYTQWYWKVDLHNLLHFLALRLDPHAQLEIRRYAEVIAAMVADWVPLSYEAFEDYRRGAVTLSRPALLAVRSLLRGEAVQPEKLGLSPREWRELMELLECPTPPSLET
jgi:thymidylate synthase (FAD)